MAITKETLDGIIAHEEEIKKQWAEAYAKAVESDNGEAIFALLKAAPKVKRASDSAVRIKKQAASYLMADKQSAEKFVSTGVADRDLDYAAARATVARKANAMRKKTCRPLAGRIIKPRVLSPRLSYCLNSGIL